MSRPSTPAHLSRRGLLAAAGAVGATGLSLAAARPAAAATLPTPAGTVAVIGDSTVGRSPDRYRAALVAMGYAPEKVYVNGLGGRPLTTKPTFRGQTSMQAIDLAKAALGTVDTWLVSLGINSFFLSDADFRLQVRQLLDLMVPSRVLWYDTSQQSPTNPSSLRTTASLREVVDADPAGTTLRWHEYVHASTVNLPELWADSTHNSNAGFDLRAMFGAAAVGLLIDPPVVTPAR